jgi:hypothetical protein
LNEPDYPGERIVGQAGPATRYRFRHGAAVRADRRRLSRLLWSSTEPERSAWRRDCPLIEMQKCGEVRSSWPSLSARR